MRSDAHKTSQTRFAILYFIQYFAPGLWNVSFSNVLREHGLEAFLPYAFACSALAAFVSPLVAGSIADRRMPPLMLARRLTWAASVLLALVFLSIDLGWGGWSMLALVLCYNLVANPIFTLTTTAVLSSLENPSADFGRVRLWGTVGWAVAGWTVSWVLMADASPISGYAAAVALALTGAYSGTIPDGPAPVDTGLRTWKERLGLDALALLRHRDHRIVYLTTALFTIPLAAFYPYTPLHLRDLGVSAPTALMSLGQVTEIACLLVLASIWKRYRLKWIFLAGILCGLLRFVFFTLDSPGWVLAGTTLHGACYVLFYITAQVYLAERVERGMQARAQALMSLVIGGVGNLVGYLGIGWWRSACSTGGSTSWPGFWWGLSVLIGIVAIFFTLSYQGVGKVPGQRA